ncbi:hypothetical protein ACFTAO_04825 [Paenibacillus rhizoplanae]
MNVQWISPFQLNAFGSISIHAGAIRGGITIKITEDYFFMVMFMQGCSFQTPSRCLGGQGDRRS